MNPIPQRSSLVAQTLAILRAELNAGVWVHGFPSENELCAKLKISRTTLRPVLAQLKHEGRLSGGQGRRSQIVQSAQTAAPPTSREVVLVSPKPLISMASFTMFWIDGLREHLAKAGYRLEIDVRTNCFGRRPWRALENLTVRTRPACWVLYLSSSNMQRWFAGRGLPFVIAGSCHGGISALSVDVTYRIACRHAAVRFLSNGHRRLALVSVENVPAGDLESETGFTEGANSIRGLSTEVTVVRHDGTVPGLRSKLSALMAQPRPPTGYLISRPVDVLTALGHFTAAGLCVPSQVSLISRDDEPYLSHMVPAITRYSSNPTLFARKISRVALEIASTGAMKPRDFRVVPRFIAGETLAKAPSGGKLS